VRNPIREGTMAIDLNESEREFLVSLLERELEDVRTELHHTQGHDYKDTLKAREALVRELLARVRA
jgi:hypothetical protein